MKKGFCIDERYSISVVIILIKSTYLAKLSVSIFKEILFQRKIVKDNIGSTDEMDLWKVDSEKVKNMK